MSNKIPRLPVVPKLTPGEIFESKQKAEEWFKAVQARKKMLEVLISKTNATLYLDPHNEKNYIIVSPSTKGYRFQLTKFDKEGAMYDCQRNNAEDIANEIPLHYILAEISS